MCVCFLIHIEQVMLVSAEVSDKDQIVLISLKKDHQTMVCNVSLYLFYSSCGDKNHFFSHILGT